MKTLNRIAPILIVLALGIAMFPQVLAVGTKYDTLQDPKKSKSARNFSGIRIYPNLVDDMLFTDSNIKTAESTGTVLYSQHGRVNTAANLSDELSHEDLQYHEQRYSKDDSEGKCKKSGNTYKR
jgi:hypothetical protein